MAGYLPEMQHLDVRPAIQAYELGQDRGNQDVQQNLLREVGQTAATQGYDAAGKRALAGGNVGLGVSLQNMSIDRQLKLYDFLGRAAQAADTPEKWTQLNSTLAKTFGPESIKGFEDFKSRESAIQLSMNAHQQAELALRKQQSAREDERLAMEKQRIAGEATPAGFTRKPDGTMSVVAGGPADPAYMRQVNDAKQQPHQMSVTDITKLSDEGQKFASLNSFGTTFKNEYAGYKVAAVGNAANLIARNTGIGNTDAAEWWQGYDRYKNVVRNELFGAALTKTEQAAFEKADINAGMEPAIIKKNLERQQEIVKNGLKRKANALISENYRPDTVAKAYGLDLKDIGVAEKGAAPASNSTKTAAAADRPKISTKAEYDKLEPGAEFTGADGKPYRKP